MTSAGAETLPTSSRVDPPDPLPWLRTAVAAVVLLLVLLSLLDLAVAYVTRSMPPSHFVAGPIALGVTTIIWFVELYGLRRSLLVFAAVVTVPNVWLAAIGHVAVNFLLLSLTVAWVTYLGSHLEGLVALAMNLAVIGVAELGAIASGYIGLGLVPWAAGLVLIWLMTRALVAQQRLAAELRVAQQDLTRQIAENARLYEQAQQTALLEERQRIARELHDAVTQTLFSSSLIADVLPRRRAAGAHARRPGRDAHLALRAAPDRADGIAAGRSLASAGRGDHRARAAAGVAEGRR
jgi:signal transduction histidine kinase